MMRLHIESLSTEVEPGHLAVQFMAFVDDRPAGVAHLGEMDTEAAWLGSVFVAPEHRRSGVARMLVKVAAEEAKQAGKKALSLTVSKGNDAARALYESLGFFAATVYRDSGAVLMSLRLDS